MIGGASTEKLKDYLSNIRLVILEIFSVSTCLCCSWILWDLALFLWWREGSWHRYLCKTSWNRYLWKTSFMNVHLWVLALKSGRIKALLFRRNINHFGDAFGEVRLPQWFLLRHRNRRRCNRPIQIIWFVYCGVFYCDVAIEIAIRQNRGAPQ